MNQNSCIDAVITWVDGRDEHHAQKLANYLAKHGLARKGAAAPTRFNAQGEFDFCLRSIFHFAPWVGTIYVVTDAQTPSLINQLQCTSYAAKIKLVDHKELFKGYEHCLPTFNSLSIESMLWRIPGLSEQFIYFNDDCMLLHPLKPTDFFRQGKPILRGAWKTQTEKKWRACFRRIVARMKNKSYVMETQPEYRVLQENSAREAGYQNRFFHMHHVPFSLRKQAFVDYFTRHPEKLEQNIRHPLRDLKQFIPISVIAHFEIKHEHAILECKSKEMMVHAGAHSLHKIRLRLKKADTKRHIIFACIQSLDEGDEHVCSLLLHWLNRRIPDIFCENKKEKYV